LVNLFLHTKSLVRVVGARGECGAPLASVGRESGALSATLHAPEGIRWVRTVVGIDNLPMDHSLTMVKRLAATGRVATVT
jgi:hypothetical protein